MPSTFVSTTRGVTETDSEDSGDEIRWACHDEGDGGVVAESLNDGREERVETT